MYYLPNLVNYLEKEGHQVLLNQFSDDIDFLIVENVIFMYDVYHYLKKIKRNNIKYINLIADIPPWVLQKDYHQNTLFNSISQYLYNIAQRNQFLFDKVKYFENTTENSKYFNLNSRIFLTTFNRPFKNRYFFQRNYRKYLKYSDLILSISKFTQSIVKRFLKLDTKLCYQCVNSDYLNQMPQAEINYDAVFISRITPQKRQTLFIKAAKKLDLKYMVLGYHADKSIKLDCPHYYFNDQTKVWDILNQSRFYVDPSIFEGFGMTPVEAAFLDKVSIVSDTFVHREVLGDYPLYFKKDNVDDLVEKMKIVMDGGFRLNNEEIKKKYSIEAFKKRLFEHIESI